MLTKRLLIILGASAVLAAAASPTLAQTPACGTVITTPGVTITFDSDMDAAPDFTGTALTVQADGVTVDGAGFSILAPDAPTIAAARYSDSITIRNLSVTGNSGIGISLESVTNSIISNVDASGSGEIGVGIAIRTCDGNLISGNTVHGRWMGIEKIVSDSNNTYVNNDLTDNATGIYPYSGGTRVGNSFVNNDVSRSSNWGIMLSGEVDFTLSGNIYTDCANGLSLTGMDSIILDGIDFSAFNIPGKPLSLDRITNSTISNINASGSSPTSYGIMLNLCDGNTLTSNTIHGRGQGIVLRVSNSYNTISANDLTDNGVGIGYYSGGTRVGNSFVNNDVSRSSIWGIMLSGEVDFTLSGNIYTDCTNGLSISGMNSTTLTGLDFSTSNIPGTVLSLNGVTNSVISDINASGSGGIGYGIGLNSSSGNTIENNFVHGRQNGIRTAQTLDDNTFRNNDLSDNVLAFYDYPAGTRSGTIITDNDFSRSTQTGIKLFNHTGLTLEGNTYTDCVNGIGLAGVDSFTMTDRDFSSANIPGTVISLESVTNSTFSGINASGSGAGGYGFSLSNTTGNVFAGNTVHGRQVGISNSRGESYNVYLGNDLSGNVQAISDYAISTPRVGNVYAQNLMSGSGHTAMRLWMEEGSIIKENTIIGGARDGIEISESSDVKISRNNILSNSRYQIASLTGNTGISLSENGQGNFWGRSCPGDLFIAGTDSNSADLIDSFPYGTENQWATGDPPGCDAQVCLDGGPYTADANTLLLLHFDGTYLGADGETPTCTTGTFEDGAFDQGVDATPTEDVWLEYPADGNIDTYAGTLEFWIKPNWDGNDGEQHTLFSAYGVQNRNHLLIPKNSANNLHFIIWDGDGIGISLGHNVSDWVADEWHHLAFTWNATEMQMFIDGGLVDTKPVPAVPITVETLNFSHSVGDQTPSWGWGPDAVIDEFRISNIRRCIGDIVPPGPVDNDGDGYAADIDCDDGNFDINPGATEVCDLLDNDCDGIVDDLGTETCGLGVCEHTIDLCINGVPQTCDPVEGSTDELCDLLDNDCDGSVDEDLGTETCGLGGCEHTIDVCVNGVTQECDPFEGAGDETCGDSLDNDCNGVVDDAADLLIEADHHVVGGGSHPGSTKTPIVGLVVGIYDKADGSCARDVCGGISWQHYECIVTNCDVVATDVTDAAGLINFALATGDYLVIGYDGSDKHLGVSASDLICGDSMRKYLQRLETANGKRHPGKTSKRTGSELLIIEPEYVEWSGVDELYPFVFESVGDWDVSTSVEPPEGFVTDYDELAEQVDNELEAVQFTLTDVGSDWVPTGSQHLLEHNGRREILVGRVGVLVAPGLALAKGLDREGHPLGPDGHPIHGPGFDPRAPRPVEVVGWIEATAVDPIWVFKLNVDETSEFSLAITRGQGRVERILFDGQLTPGEYELDWDGLDERGRPLGPGRHWLTLTSGDMVQKEKFIKRQ